MLAIFVLFFIITVISYEVKLNRIEYCDCDSEDETNPYTEIFK